MPDGQSNCFVDSKARYAAAQSEINSRLQIRGTVNIAHMSVIGVALGSYFTLKSQQHGSYYLTFAFLMPLLSAYFVTYYIHNDRILGLLGAFCRTLEKISEEKCPSAKLPRWFSAAEEQWLVLALDARKFSDYAIIGLCIVSPIVVCFDSIYAILLGGILGFLRDPNIIQLGLLLVYCTTVSAFNVKRLCGIREFRRRLSEDYEYDQETREFKKRRTARAD